jgi:predicted amidohydrolase YtcJ
VPLTHKHSGQADLDADPVLRDRPIVLYRKDLHAAWVSSKALRLTIPNLPDKVDGGEIKRDSKGEPTGISDLLPVS